ncbi:MAG: hypothetical protein BGO39_03580 [Chloroflexi bacterium 54-19]|nr:MAG: hypothetical protein BGO39_03580 [Chloroflexi bacterium 54-19]
MNIAELDPCGQVVYHLHRFIRTFRPVKNGGNVGSQFENRLRSSFSEKFSWDLLSAERDLGLGHGMESGSGLSHELDLVARLGVYLFIIELKYYTAGHISKEMVMVFNQKVHDFYLENYPQLSHLKIYRIFATRCGYVDESIRRFCAMWGILLIDNQLLTAPLCSILVESVREAVQTRDFTTTSTPSWANCAYLDRLSGTADGLSAKMWPDFNTIASLQLPFSSGQIARFGGLSPAFLTSRWVSHQQQLSKQVSRLQSQFLSWQNFEQIRKKSFEILENPDISGGEK